MKKEDNTKLTVDEILEEIENAGLDTPKMQCSICGKEKPAHAVYTLPEVWRHGRRLALYMLGKAPRPALSPSRKNGHENAEKNGMNR